MFVLVAGTHSFFVTEVKSLPHRRTLTHVNNFIISTTQFINRFSFLCEEKLSKVSRDIQRLEIVLAMLEAKLRSIPGIENAPKPQLADAPTLVNAGVSSVTYDTPNTAAATPVIAQPTVATEATTAPPLTAAKTTSDLEQVPTEAAAPTTRYRDDPQYALYFRMLDLKIPIVAVRQKMIMDGLDASVLDHGEL
jgi:WASH complex subunit CCDC53